MTNFPHINPKGDVHMVDVGTKGDSERVGKAEAIVLMSDATADALFSGTLPKGDALASVRLAGIMGAKKTPDLIPLCHPIALTGVTVDVQRVQAGTRIVATARTTGKTGVEMEAMAAVSVAALALYDMVKGTEREVEIASIRLLLKDGGKSGRWER